MPRTATTVTHLDADTIASDVEEWLRAGEELHRQSTVNRVLLEVNALLPHRIVLLRAGVIEYDPAQISAGDAAEMVDEAYFRVGTLFEVIAHDQATWRRLRRSMALHGHPRSTS